MNTAVLQTLPRTVNTGMGAVLILAALAVLGGDTLTDFALAALIGVVVGTYSSVFVAAPLALEGGPRAVATGRPPPLTPPSPGAQSAAGSGTGSTPTPSRRSKIRCVSVCRTTRCTVTCRRTKSRSASASATATCR